MTNHSESRWWILDPHPENVIPKVEQAVSHNVVGIVDENRGGIVAYASDEVAQEIVRAMNSTEDEK